MKKQQMPQKKNPSKPALRKKARKAGADDVPSRQPFLKRLLFGEEKPDLTELESGSTTILDILSPTAVDTKSRDYIVVDGVFHAYLYITGYGYSTTVGSCWLAPLVEAGEGVSVSFMFRRQSKDKILSKIAQTTMINRSRMRDVGDTRQDYEELDSAISSGLYLKDVMNRQGEDFYYMNTKLIPYGEAYRRLRLPVHLLSCDDTGAIQLQILATPGYRPRLTQAALKSQYVPPPEGAPALDAMFQGLPFVMAADMDLRRIDAALTTAQRMGRPQIALAALKGQAESVLFSRYRDPGLARVFVLTRGALAEALGRPPAPHIPSRMQYLTEKGDVVDAASVRTDRTARGLAGAQMRERVPPPGADRETAI